ncbi:MAG: hypothetical protein INR68_13875 [Methylobacterium mesophilicum]|nr:hypothetical protein [Methylobacterium mesophilicum]
MCVGVMAAATTALSAGGQVAGFLGAKKAAAEQNLYNMKVETQQLQYRVELTNYNNKTYEQDIKYGGEVLDYQKNEFRRQNETLDRATTNIQDNYFVQVGTLMKRMVEENISAAFQMDDVAKASRKEKASRQVQADARGVEGNSVEAVISDVARQEGDAITVMEMNRSATQRQLMLEAMQLKTSADGAIMNLPVNTYQPLAPAQPPAPISPVAPAPKMNGPSVGSLVTGIAGSFVDGANNYASWSGMTLAQRFGVK